MMRFRGRRRVAVAALAFVLSACATTAPPATTPVVPAPPPITLDAKVAGIFVLEQQRVLADPAVPVDLIGLAHDPDPGVRRRALLAVGRAGMAEGLPALTDGLADPEEIVRATSAFALGLLGDARAVTALEAALQDPSPLVRGRAAEGLGLIGRPAAAAAPRVATAAAGCGVLMATVPPDEERPQEPEVEFCRLAVLAFVRLGAYESLAAVTLDADGRPVTTWWPVAFAFQRLGDRRGAEPLARLLETPGTYTPAFAMRGLATLRDPRVVPAALAAASRADADVRLRVSAIRALGQAGDPAAVTPLVALLAETTPEVVLLEALAALGALKDARAFDPVLDLIMARSPRLRRAAMAAAAAIDPEGFLLVLSSLERDRDWTVRAALATALGAVPGTVAHAALSALADDPDVRVQAPALRAMAAADAPGVDRRLFDALAAPDVALRATAATAIGDRRPPEGVANLVAAYELAKGDATPTARLAIVEALGRIGAPAALATVNRALEDPAWAVRARAAALLRATGDADARPVRPAAFGREPAFFESEGFLRPAYSPQAYVETPAGTIQLELDVVNAPVTVQTFIDLARAGFFDGLRVHRLIPNFVIQTGDPRGDGWGGPGFWIVDELSPRPYVRGTVGMGLSGPDTGGSQFFIALSPQPHLDARYTVFARVVAGLDLLDRVMPDDIVRRIRIWDGQ